jgi:glycosyltransferase involved in cell wall biosynthesis
MAKILINRKIVSGPWGGGNNFLKSLHDVLLNHGHTIAYDMSHKDIDLIVMFDPRYDELGISINEIAAYKNRHPNVKILHRINECDARKNTNDIDNLLLMANELVDETVFISQWLREYFIEKGFSKVKRSYVIYNGCDSSHFYPQKNLESKKVQTPIKIVTHHWSDNWMKGFDAYKYLDQLCQEQPDKYQFTYVGRYAKEYTPIATKIVKPLHGKELGDELRKHDVYVTASRWEPCGMHHIEGASSGLPVIHHKDGGGIVEGCMKHGLSFSKTEELPEKLEKVFQDYKNLTSKIDYNFLSFERCLKSYLELIASMI